MSKSVIYNSIALVIVLLALVILSLFKLNWTNVELIVLVDELAFSTYEETQWLATGLELTEISFSDIGALSNEVERVELPTNQLLVSFTIETNDISSSSSNVPIFIEDIRLAPHSTVRLTDLESDKHRLHVQATEFQLDVFTNTDLANIYLGGLPVSGNVEPFESVTVFSRPAAGRTSGQEELLFDFAFVPSSNTLVRNPVVIAEQMQIRNLQLYRDEPFGDIGFMVTRRTSTIDSGELYLEGLGGRQLELRPGERLRFDQSEGELRLIRIEKDGLYVHFRGRVRGMRTGRDEAPENLMPSVLEYAVSQSSVVTVVSIFIASIPFVRALLNVAKAIFGRRRTTGK